MISIEQQQSLLLAISRRLKRKITAYAIGGTAMMFLGFKDVTLDINLVFENEKDRDAFKKAALSLGYQEMDAVKIYGIKRNTPQMLRLADERFDLFVLEVIDFIFSEDMQKRAEQTHQFGDALILKIADPHDLILMKCATDRLKDKDDARRVIDAVKIDWSVLIAEAQNQIKLGKQRAALDLGYFLEGLAKMGVSIPQEVLDALFDIVAKQAKEKKGK